MRIQQVRIRRYRCLKDLTLKVDDYTALVGPNGSGKSSVLYALDWFFNGGSLSPGDVHCTSRSTEADQDENRDIDVEVTFGELTQQDREVLGRYGRSDRATFRRTWSQSDGKEKMIGNSRQGPGFAAIRGASTASQMQSLYAEARRTFSSLGPARARADMEQQLTDWENDPVNAEALEEVDSDNATYMFGFDGEHTLAKRTRLVLVPASSDISDEITASGRSSAVAKLIGAVMAEAVSTVRARWESEHAEDLRRLTAEVKASVEQATRSQATRINRLLVDLIPTASLDFVPAVPEWAIKGDTSIQTDVIIGGERKNIERQGSGVQRAVMISLLQALVPDEMVVQAGAGDGQITDQGMPEEQQAALPALVMCIEEPEMCQHPVRARHFGRVLAQWSQRARSQVMVATHSPYFVLPEQFASLRRFALADGSSVVRTATVNEVAAAAAVSVQDVERAMGRELPRTYSEGFFADAVVFVEGDTDRVVLEVLAERLGRSLDANGTAVLAMGGKSNLKVPYFLLDLVGVPCYVIADGDVDGAARKHPGDKVKQAEVARSHQQATDALISWLPAASSAQVGSVPYAWGHPTVVTDKWCMFRDDLEAELSDWPEFMVELGRHGEGLRSKNLAVVRSAALDADLNGLPESLKQLVAALGTFGR